MRPVLWSDLFETWRSMEAHLPHWQRISAERGWDSWEEWRDVTLVKAYRLPELSWTIGTLADPTAEIPAFRGGPFKSWIENAYAGQHSPTPTFAELAHVPYIRSHERIAGIVANFPDPTTLIALRTADGTVVIEGTHRSCAAAMLAADGHRITANVSIAIADYPFGPLPVLGQARKSR